MSNWIPWRSGADRGGKTTAGRDADLSMVRGWFEPAFQTDEELRAALMAIPYRLTVVDSLVTTAKELAGRNQGRVPLLTDRAIHVARRTFWRRRFGRLLASYPIGTVPVCYAGGVGITMPCPTPRKPNR